MLGIVTPHVPAEVPAACRGALHIHRGVPDAPGDLVWTTLALAIQLYLLYELCILLSTIM